MRCRKGDAREKLDPRETVSKGSSAPTCWNAAVLCACLWLVVYRVPLIHHPDTGFAMSRMMIALFILVNSSVLNSNLIDDTGLTLLSEGLAANPPATGETGQAKGLITLLLAGNPFGDPGLSALTRMLTTGQNSSLSVLDIHNGRFMVYTCLCDHTFKQKICALKYVLVSPPSCRLV